MLPGLAHAQMTNRYNTALRGNFMMIGNTLAQDVGPGVPAPLVGSVGASGTNTNDTAPDVFWRADSPSDGQAEANNTITATQARTTAHLTIPAGATVRKAYLYAAARAPGGVVPTTITLEVPGIASQAITPVDNSTVALNGTFYQTVSDVTEFVQQQGSGNYRVSGVSSVALANLNDATIAVGWSMVIVYESCTEPYRQIQIKDGLNLIIDGSPASVTFSGLNVASGTASLGVFALEGDDPSTGDALKLNGTALSNALNPADNFFNSTRSSSGTAVSVSGDLPRLTGGARSMSGVDLDIADITGSLTTGDASFNVQAETSGDTYVVGLLVAGIPAPEPASALTVSIAATPSLTAGQGQSLTLTASGADSYSWSGGESTTAISVTASGTYSVTGITGCDSGTARVDATVLTAPPCDPTVVARAVSVTQTAALGVGACAVTVQGTGFGTSFRLTGPNDYVYSAVYRRPGNYNLNALAVRQPGTYTFMAAYQDACGQESTQTMTFIVTGTACP